jgi:hypothetical protein
MSARTVLIAAATAALLAAPVLAQAPNAGASKYGPISCVYDRLTPAARGKIDIQNIDSEANAKLIDAPFTACGRQHRWAPQLFPVVVEYLIARLAFDRADAELIKAGAKAGDGRSAYAALKQGDKDYLRGTTAFSDDALRRMAPTIHRFGGPAVDLLFALDGMAQAEAAWARLG